MSKEFYHKKKWGQHFLNDPNIIRKIVKSAEIQPGEHVWEIGPGKGVLTDEILNYNPQLTIFEIDPFLIPYLQERYQDVLKSGKAELIHKDVMKTNWSDYIGSDKIKIVANLPYQITSPLMFKIVDYIEHFESVTIMIQKEVADRIAAKARTKDYGNLTIMLNYFFNIEKISKVPPHLFTPAPKVHSTVIRLTPRDDSPEVTNINDFKRVVRCAFSNRRKMLRRNFRDIMTSQQIDHISNNFDLSRRGETLSEAEFIWLSNTFSSIN